MGGNGRSFHRKRDCKGFTLVELIVVIVILAILAAILIPGLLGWIDKAKEKKYEVEARNIYLAAEASFVEGYVRGFKDANDKMIESDKTGHYTIIDTYDQCEEWISYIEEMSGIDKVHWVRCYFDNGRLKALSIDYESPTDGKYLKAWFNEIGFEYSGDSGDYDKWKKDDGMWHIVPHPDHS